MKNKFIAIRVLFSLFIAFMISCSDDDLTKEEGEEIETPEVGYNNYMGYIEDTEEEWNSIPLLTDIRQLNLGTSPKTRNNKPVIVSGYEYLPHFNQIEDNEGKDLGGTANTCVASAVANGVAMLVYNLSGMSFTNPELFNGNARTFSVAYLHTESKNHLNNGVGITGGRNLYSVLETLKINGVPTAANREYTYDNISRSVTNGEIHSKAKFTSTNIFRIDNNRNDVQFTENVIKKILDLDNPVFISMRIPKKLQIIKDGVITKEKVKSIGEGEEIINKAKLTSDFNNNNALLEFIIDGRKAEEVKKTIEHLSPMYDGHAMTIIGYDNKIGKRGAFLVLNSWSKNWGGYKGENPTHTPAGCFWLEYDLIGATFEDLYNLNNIVNGGFFPLKESNIIVGFATLGLKEELKLAKQSLLYEFTGFENYMGVEYSNNKMNTDFMNIIPSVKLNQGDFIKYPSETVIPDQGTIEMEFKIDKIYSEDFILNTDNKTYTSQGRKSGGAFALFSTLVQGQMESYVGQDPNHTVGALALRINSTGDVWINVADRSYDSMMKEAEKNPGTASMTNIRMYRSKHKINLDEWNKISLSYGSEGLSIKIKENEAESFNWTAPISTNMLEGNFKPGSKTIKKFTVGYNLSIHNRWAMIFPDGTASLGRNNKLYDGFEGNINAFRTSDKQKDWVITAHE